MLIGKDKLGNEVHTDSKLYYTNNGRKGILDPDLIGWNKQNGEFTEVEGYDPELMKRVVAKLSVVWLR